MRIHRWYHSLFGFKKCPTCLHWFYPRKSLPQVHIVNEATEELMRVMVCASCAEYVNDANFRRRRFGS